MAVLDTNVLVDLLRSPNNRFHVRASREVAALHAKGEAIATTRINVAELFVGVELSTDPKRELQGVENLLQSISVLEFDEPAARYFGIVAAHLRKMGRPSGDLDALIGAIAVVNGQELLTRNTSHFANILGLIVRSY